MLYTFLSKINRNRWLKIMRLTPLIRRSLLKTNRPVFNLEQLKRELTDLLRSLDPIVEKPFNAKQVRTELTSLVKSLSQDLGNNKLLQKLGALRSAALSECARRGKKLEGGLKGLEGQVGALADILEISRDKATSIMAIGAPF